MHTGVTTDKNTPLNAAIMSATVLLYLVIQVPQSSETLPGLHAQITCQGGGSGKPARQPDLLQADAN